MDIEFSCSHCNQNMIVDEEGAGLEIQCPHCHNPITIPQAKPSVSALKPLNENLSNAASPVITRSEEPLLLTQLCVKCERAWPEDSIVCGHCGTALRETVPAGAARASVATAPRVPASSPAFASSAQSSEPHAERSISPISSPPRIPPAPGTTAQPPLPGKPPPLPARAEELPDDPAMSEPATTQSPIPTGGEDPEGSGDQYQCMNPHCGRTWYESQLSIQQVGRKSIKVCPQCRLGVSKIRKQLNFWKVAPSAFLYPFKGAGGWILGLGCLLAVFLDVGGAIGGFIIGLIAMGFFFGFFGMLLINAIRSTADDPAETLDWPELTSFGEVLSVAFRWLVTTLMVFGPALICYYVASQNIENDYGRSSYGSSFGSSFATGRIGSVWDTWWALPIGFLSILGASYYPMSLLAVAMFDSWKGINPVLVVPPIFKLPFQYLLILTLIGGMVIVRRAMAKILIGERQIWGALMGHGSFLWTAIGFVCVELLALYCLIVSARLLGLLYHTYSEKIGWFE